MTRDDDLTARQRAAVDFIASHHRDHGYPPTVREIGKAVGQSSASTTHDMLNRLERQGIIKRDPGLSRSVVLVGDERCPSCGRRSA